MLVTIVKLKENLNNIHYKCKELVHKVKLKMRFSK